MSKCIVFVIETVTKHPNTFKPHQPFMSELKMGQKIHSHGIELYINSQLISQGGNSTNVIAIDNRNYHHCTQDIYFTDKSVYYDTKTKSLQKISYGIIQQIHQIIALINMFSEYTHCIIVTFKDDTDYPYISNIMEISDVNIKKIINKIWILNIDKKNTDNYDVAYEKLIAKINDHGIRFAKLDIINYFGSVKISKENLFVSLDEKIKKIKCKNITLFCNWKYQSCFPYNVSQWSDFANFLITKNTFKLELPNDISLIFSGSVVKQNHDRYNNRYNSYSTTYKDNTIYRELSVQQIKLVQKNIDELIGFVKHDGILLDNRPLLKFIERIDIEKQKKMLLQTKKFKPFLKISLPNKNQFYDEDLRRYVRTCVKIASIEKYKKLYFDHISNKHVQNDAKNLILLSRNDIPRELESIARYKLNRSGMKKIKNYPNELKKLAKQVLYSGKTMTKLSDRLRNNYQRAIRMRDIYTLRSNRATENGFVMIQIKLKHNEYVKIQFVACKSCNTQVPPDQIIDDKCTYCLYNVTIEKNDLNEVFVSECIKCNNLFSRNKGALHHRNDKCYYCRNDIVSPKRSFYKPKTVFMKVHITKLKNVKKESIIDMITKKQNIDVQLYFNNKIILNNDTVIEEIKNIMSEQFHADCMLCYDEIPLKNLVEACGYCPNKICEQCKDKWYGQVKAGHKLTLRMCLCPLCQKIPKNNSYVFMKLRKWKEMDQHKEYAWCRICDIATELPKDECNADGAEVIFTKFTCENCVGMDSYRQCRCGALIQKIYGCNHITCPVKGCGVHMCYLCCAYFSTDESCYYHLWLVHGGYFGEADIVELQNMVHN